MLSKIRSGVDHIIIRIILGIVALSFVGFGGVSFMSGNSRGDAVTFSEAESITMEKFLKAKYQKIDAIQKNNGINLTDEQIQNLNIDQAVLQDLITASMMDHIADTYEFNISDEKVISLAKKSPMFQNEEGKFDPQRYKSIFANSKNNETEYLQFVRNQIIHGTIAELFSTSFKVPKIMGNNMVNFIAETKNVNIYKMNLSFKSKGFNPGNPDQELLQEIFTSNQKIFTLPEQRSFKYIKISEDFLAKKITITEQDLKKYYEENQDEFLGNSYKKAKKEVKQQLTISLLDDLTEKFVRNLEDDVAAGMSLEEISKKHALRVSEVNDTSKNNLINSKKNDYLELADPIFDMIVGEISYPIEVKDKHEILLATLDSISPERNQEFDEVKDKILESWKVRELSTFNMKKFIKFAEENKLTTNTQSLEKLGIQLITKPSLTRVDMHSGLIPPKIFNQIFEIEDKNKTKIFQAPDGFAYFAYVNKSYIDNKKKKIVEQQGLEHFQNTIRESLLHEMISNMMMKNNAKVNLNSQPNS